MLDCIIVGAGLAGLRAADEFVRAGREVVVLEARDRVGGRCENVVTEEGTILEMGGQWISPSHEQMLELVRRHGKKLVDSSDGSVVVRLQGSRRQIPTKAELDEAMSPFELADLGQGLLRFRRLGERIEADPAWVDANAKWLQQKVRTWIGTNLRTPGGQHWFEQVFVGAFGGDGCDMELMEGLHRANNGLDLESLLAVNGQVKQQRIAGGIAGLCEAMATELGDRVVTGAVVATIEQTLDIVRVTTTDGRVLEAADVIVTLPPRLVSTIEFVPELPEWRAEMAQKVPAGNVIKAALVYDHPWWRREGLSGQVGSDEGAMRVIMDNSGPDDKHGVLMGFFEGNDAPSVARRSPFLRQRAMEEVVRGAFGEHGHHATFYTDRNWAAEDYTGGCHGAHFAPGVWTASGPALGTSEGRVHFAGAEYANKFNGYMEGAVRCGARVAQALIKG